MLSSLHSLRSSEAPVLPAPVVLEAGGYAGSLDDILAAAAWRGELDAFRSRWETIQAAAARAEALGQFPEPAAVEAATNEFRYARDLVSAEECEGWLAARGLTFADLTACVTRRLQAELAPAGEPQGGGLSSPPASAVRREQSDSTLNLPPHVPWAVARNRPGAARCSTAIRGDRRSV